MSDDFADLRRIHRFWPSSHENTSKSTHESKIRPDTTRIVLHPKSRKGISYQSGVLQQHRFDRVIDEKQQRIIRLPRPDCLVGQEAEENDGERECFHKIQPPSLHPQLTIDYSPISFSDTFMEVSNCPGGALEVDWQNFTLEMIVPDSHAKLF